MSAPQYPEGIGMKIWVNKITGEKPHDLKNINGLNHYIGMKPIEPDSIKELKIIPFVLGFLFLLGVVAVVANNRKWVVSWLVIFLIAAFIGLVDFYKWEYDYGHNLDPQAPIKVPGMTYQPPLIGSKKLLNITASSYPDIGGWFAFLSIGFGVTALYADTRRKKIKEKHLHHEKV